MKDKAASPMELYVHIPFCVKKCDYCDFLSGPAGEEEQRAYIQALLAETGAMAVPERPVASVFVGGGTPSLVDVSLMGAVFEKIKKSFTLAPDAEITLEANPGTLCQEKLRAYRSFGVNRLSLGLQSPREEELKSLGRIHTYAQFLENFFLAREAGFSNINVDLMSAIPGQTYEGWTGGLRTVAELGPEHISAYSLIVEEGTPFAQRVLELPDEDTEYRMYEDTAAVLAEYGYEQYEISNYAKKGRACVHNTGYWKRVEYLGLGLGAASLWNGRRFSNTRDMGEYLRDSGVPEKIHREKIRLSREESMAEFMFLGLRMTEGVGKKDFQMQFGCDIEEIYGNTIEKYRKLGMLEELEDRIFLTRPGIHVSNIVMADFL